MDCKIKVYIEIEKNSNKKYEFNHETNKLELDRILKDPYVYPYAYGFALNTKASDGDELDVLIISDKEILNDTFYEVFIVGVLVMEDEGGMDEKVLCVLEEDYNNFKLEEDAKNKINDFFTNYKNNTIGKWSKVYGFENKEFASKLYQTSLVPFSN
jgi:inorganic pyrophosphatase